MTMRRDEAQAQDLIKVRQQGQSGGVVGVHLQSIVEGGDAQGGIQVVAHGLAEFLLLLVKDSLIDFPVPRLEGGNAGDELIVRPLGVVQVLPPGWHIECSAISMKHLGEDLDIHCGGIDNAFPHHTNEIAQSEAYLGHKWCSWWMHVLHLNTPTGKMRDEVALIALVPVFLHALPDAYGKVLGIVVVEDVIPS